MWRWESRTDTFLCASENCADMLGSEAVPCSSLHSRVERCFKDSEARYFVLNHPNAS